MTGPFVHLPSSSETCLLWSIHLQLAKLSLAIVFALLCASRICYSFCVQSAVAYLFVFEA